MYESVNQGYYLGAAVIFSEMTESLHSSYNWIPWESVGSTANHIAISIIGCVVTIHLLAEYIWFLLKQAGVPGNLRNCHI